jgi:hypothetical protein
MADCTVLFPRPERKNGDFDARNRFGKAVFSDRFDAMSTFYTNLADRPGRSLPLCVRHVARRYCERLSRVPRVACGSCVRANHF